MLNVITLVGRLTRDPELRRTNSGTSVGAFTIAVDDSRKGPNGEKQTLFMDCTVFGAQADTLTKFFRKGNLIAISGRLVSRKYTNSQGVNVTAYSVNVDRLEFVESAAKMNGAAAEMPMDTGFSSQVNNVSEKQNLDSIDVTDDDLPF
ncbi:MAG: single-stranded DNA-binding protein [Bacilli bacterium]|jgi:single-strand DNA-binding protein|nr:single-stranded DNA-binding protein [Bacilli bacterium]MBO6284744.1 single-stranded DNA-binding protein [Bacilli bacterium]MBQ4255787.1 single-stranded DNA-binding protein [Bacilli bacterium]